MTAVFLAGSSGRTEFVLQEHHRPCGVGARGGDGVRPQLRRGGLRHVDVRVLEQAGAELDPQDPAHRVVHAGDRDLALGDELCAVVAQVGADHLHVGAGVQRERARRRPVGRDAVPAGPGVRGLRRAGPELVDGGVVALDEAVEAPLLLEDLGLGLGVGAARHPVEGVERAHGGVGAGVDRGLERRQVEVAQPLLGHVRGVVVAAAFGLPVGREVLDAGDHLVGCAVARALVALHPRGGHHRAHVGVLAVALGDPAPARLVRDVDHGAVDLLDPDGGGLPGAEPGVVVGHLRVEGARRRQRDREHGAVAVDGVVGEQDRDVQPGLLHGDVLQMVDLHGVDQAEDAAHAGLGVGVGDLPVGEQLDLLQLLPQGHPAQQVVHALLDRLAGRRSARLHGGLVGRLVGCGDPAGQSRHQGDHRQARDHGMGCRGQSRGPDAHVELHAVGKSDREQSSPSSRSVATRKGHRRPRSAWGDEATAATGHGRVRRATSLNRSPR